MKIKQDYIRKNRYSRPGRIMSEVKGIVIHGTACPRATAQNVRDYFDRLADEKKRYASSQYVVGKAGEVIQCMPSNEVAWHCGSKTYTDLKKQYLGRGNPNYCTIGIELCHEKHDGEFTDATLESAAELVRYLRELFVIGTRGKKVWQHKQVVGWKNCPLWLVNHPDEWHKFLDKCI